MNKNIENAILEYQCSGCIGANVDECYTKGTFEECSGHVAGTYISGVGKIFLGMPKGFNRLGNNENIKIYIFENIENEQYDKFNVPVWKHLNKAGHTIVRGIQPRLNYSFIHIFLEDCLDKIDCINITDDDILNMD